MQSQCIGTVPSSIVITGGDFDNLDLSYNIAEEVVDDADSVCVITKPLVERTEPIIETNNKSNINVKKSKNKTMTKSKTKDVSKSEGSLSYWIIAAIAIGVLSIVGGIAAYFFFYLRKSTTDGSDSIESQK